MSTSSKNIVRVMAVVAASFALCLSLAGCGGEPKQQGGGGSAEGVTRAEADNWPFTWTADSDCSICHESQSLSLTDSSCQISANHADTQCVECHADEAGLTQAHKNVAIADTDGCKKLSKTCISQDACIDCHADAGGPDATASSTALTDDNGTTVNPHDLPQNSSHETITCGNCHTMHSSEQIGESASAACTQCHHQNVYECFTCHE